MMTTTPCVSSCSQEYMVSGDESSWLNNPDNIRLSRESFEPVRLADGTASRTGQESHRDSYTFAYIARRFSL